MNRKQQKKNNHVSYAINEYFYVLQFASPYVTILKNEVNDVV